MFIYFVCVLNREILHYRAFAFGMEQYVLAVIGVELQKFQSNEHVLFQPTSKQATTIDVQMHI